MLHIVNNIKIYDWIDSPFNGGQALLDSSKSGDWYYSDLTTGKEFVTTDLMDVNLHFFKKKREYANPDGSLNSDNEPR